MENRVLVADDEREIADLVELYLKNEGFTIYKFYGAREALKCIDETELDLAVLDIMLPGADGLDICRHIREKYTYPIIMLTARDSETDKITGLTLGADDYVTKPFKPLELVARVKAQLRRYKKYGNAEKESGIITHSGLIINTGAREVSLDERPLSLTPTEFTILRILCERKGSVVSSENLFQEIWGDEYFAKNNNTITVHIRHIREKMGDATENPKYIKTVRNVGYRFIGA